MIRNLLYSLSVHLLIILAIYLNFNFQEFVDLDSNQPITVSFVAIKEVKSTSKDKKRIKDTTNKAKQEKKKPKTKKEIKKIKKEIKKDKKKIKSKKKNKKSASKKSDKKSDKDQKKKIVASKENKNVEKTDTLNLSARERLNIKLQIKKCYKKALKDSLELSFIPITINVKLKLSGVINLSTLKVLNKEDFKDSASDLKISLENSKKALRLCSPVRNLPKDKYDIWKEIELTFDPNE